jgi:hypothetical protein
MDPILFPQRTTYLPASSEGAPYRRSPDHHVITAKPLAISTRVAIYGALCPGGLPYPCPGQYAHQWTLTDREEHVLGNPLDDRYTPYNGRLQIVESGNWMSLMS